LLCCCVHLSEINVKKFKSRNFARRVGWYKLGSLLIPLPYTFPDITVWTFITCSSTWKVTLPHADSSSMHVIVNVINKLRSATLNWHLSEVTCPWHHRQLVNYIFINLAELCVVCISTFTPYQVRWVTLKNTYVLYVYTTKFGSWKKSKYVCI
jgi:hypothetical protein